MSDEPRDLLATREAVAASRQKVEDRLEALRTALQESSGVRLVRRTWTLPLVAAAVGFSLAMLLRARARRARAAGTWHGDDGDL